MPRISDAEVQRLFKEPVNTVIRDSDLKGFQARRTEAGVSFHYEYREGYGRKGEVMRVFIGQFSETLDSKAAREVAKVNAAEAYRKRNPAAALALARTVPTLYEFADSFYTILEAVAKARPEEAPVRESTLRNYRGLIRNHIGPAFGDKRLNEIKPAEVRLFHRTLSIEKPTTANRCVEVLGGLYKEARIQELVSMETNPTFGIVANKERKREKYLAPQELSRLGDALRIAETTGIPYYSAAIRMRR